jgi:hypothetical protein
MIAELAAASDLRPKICFDKSEGKRNVITSLFTMDLGSTNESGKPVGLASSLRRHYNVKE